MSGAKAFAHIHHSEAWSDRIFLRADDWELFGHLVFLLSPAAAKQRYSFKYLSSGGKSSSLISGCCWFLGGKRATPGSMRFSTGPPCRRFSTLLTTK